jgi:NADH:ubiquinone reductase (non-electrogenic)
MAKLPEGQTNKRGIIFDDYLRMKGARDIFAIGDCTTSSYAPTAQVASQQGSYLARVFKIIAQKDKLEADLSRAETSEEAEKLKKQVDKQKLKPFHYSHQGSLACVVSLFYLLLLLTHYLQLYRLG